MDAEIPLADKAIGQTLGRIAKAGGQVTGHLPGAVAATAFLGLAVATHSA
jgi:hypothetical protein